MRQPESQQFTGTCCYTPMKKWILILVSTFVLGIFAQAYIRNNVGNTETHAYTVVKTYPEFEVRKYAPALFTSVDLPGKTYSDNSGDGFRILASYIFGGNERNEQIAMTSPVVMEMGEALNMKFMVPSAMDEADMPKPNRSDIRFEKHEEKIMAAVRFGGWANDEKINTHIALLSQALADEGIEHTGHFSYLGYNPPYEVSNRRNEVVVELLNYQP